MEPGREDALEDISIQSSDTHANDNPVVVSKNHHGTAGEPVQGRISHLEERDFLWNAKPEGLGDNLPVHHF